VARISAAVPALLGTAASFNAAAIERSLETIPRVAVVGGASKADLLSLYTDQMSDMKGGARRFYDLIRNSSPNGKCPLCGVGQVRTLDHHLPKSRYPALAVCPYNLVPACDFCQSGKLAKFPSSPGEQTIHPYYDNFTDQQWIFGALNTAGSPALIFRVDAPKAWPAVDQARVNRHFTVFKLGLVYTSNANDDLSTLRDQLERIGAIGGRNAVLAHLEDERDRWVQRVNSWQHVMFQTLAENTWFLDGGYRRIAG
jgi:hypothetical protein